MKDEIKEILDKLKNIHNFDYNEETDSKGNVLNKSYDIYLSKEETDKLLDYINNLQEIAEEHKNCSRKHWQQKCAEHCVNEMIYKSRNEKAIEYLTSYESIETIQQCDHSENNKNLDEKTIIEIVRRYLTVHDELLNILQGSDEE